MCENVIATKCMKIVINGRNLIPFIYYILYIIGNKS